MERLFTDEVMYGIQNLSRHIPIVIELIAPVLKVAHTMQSEIGNINLKEILLSNEGIWKVAVVVNGQTKELRNEEDCTYALIHVPKQENEDKCNA